MPRNDFAPRATCTATVAAAIGTLAFTSVTAADWRIEPRVEVGGLFNDNYRLTPVEENDVQGALADAAVRFRSVTQTSDLFIAPRVRATYFPDDEDFDSTNEYLNFGYTHQAQTWRFGLDGLYSREDLLTSEQPEADAPDAGEGLGGGTDVDSGSLSADNRRDLIRFAPSASFDLTQTQALEFALQYLSAEYEETNQESIVDFDSVSGSAGMSFRFSPRQRVVVAATGTSFDPDTPLTGRTTSYGVKGELWTERTEILQSYLRLGAERTKEDDPEIGEAPDASTNYILGAGITAKYQVTTIFADYSRGVRPNGVGVLVTRDDLRVRVRRSFTPTMAGFVGVLGANDTDASDEDDFRDRRYYAGSAGLEWRFTPSFALVGAYDYRRQKRDGEGTATSNQIALSVVYEPPRRETGIQPLVR